MSRIILGNNQVQGIDYAYTIQGWLKGINSTSSVFTTGANVAGGQGKFDIGQDGLTNSKGEFINTGANLQTADAYGFSLNYFNGDYKPVSNTVMPFAGIGLGNDLFNGNIKAMAVNTPRLGNPLIYDFKYDQLNRLVAMDAYNGLDNATNTFTPVGINDYKERLTYDPNGNIKTYLRNGTGSSLNLNNYNYSYTANTNQLQSIVNATSNQTKTYAYDAIGNTTTDNMQGVQKGNWNIYGKLQSVTKTDETVITYTYDASGQRISKKVGLVEEWYVRDASGNIMATYVKEATINSGHLSTSEFYKYGSSLLGTQKILIDVQTPVAGAQTIFSRGQTDYLLNDHRGNNMAAVSDRRQQHSSNGITVDYYTADVRTASTYSAFGAITNSYNSASIKLAFNGQRRSTEISATAQTAEFWEYNGDVGRRWNLDPKPTFAISEYSAFNNNPVWFSDPFGDTPSNRQLVDALKIASAEIKDRIENKQGFYNDDAKKNLAKTSVAYEEKNQLSFGDFKDFQNAVSGYYNGLGTIAMQSISAYEGLDNEVINNKRVNNKNTIIASVFYMRQYEKELNSTMQSSLTPVYLGMTGGLFPVVGAGPGGTRLNSGTQPQIVSAKRGFSSFSGAEKAWQTGATPKSVYTYLSSDGKAVSNYIYNSEGNVIYQVDFGIHGKFSSGHGHQMKVPGNLGSGHSSHIPVNQVPKEYLKVPQGVHYSVPPGQ